MGRNPADPKHFHDDLFPGIWWLKFNSFQITPTENFSNTLMENYELLVFNFYYLYICLT